MCPNSLGNAHLMNSFDDIAPYFVRVHERWPDAPNLQSHYQSVKKSFEENRNDLLEQMKSFLEMVCITILNELGKDIPSNSDTTHIVRVTLDALGVRNQRGASEFDKVLSALHRMTDALTSVRNHAGGVAHGKDGFLDVIQKNHALMYVLATNTVLSVIMESFDGVSPDLRVTREPYERFNHLHRKIDDSINVDTNVDEDGTLIVTVYAENEYPLRIPPSQLLYAVDRQAYIDILEEVKSISMPSPSTEEDAHSKAVVSDVEPSQQDVQHHKRYQIQTSYNGLYSDYVQDFYEYLYDNLKSQNSEMVRNLTYTILYEMDKLSAPDWKKRQTILANIRRMIKRVFKLTNVFLLDQLDAKKVTEWLTNNLPDNGIQ